MNNCTSAVMGYPLEIIRLELELGRLNVKFHPGLHDRVGCVGW